MKETGSPKMMTSPKERVAEATERRPGERSEPGRSGGASANVLHLLRTDCLRAPIAGFTSIKGQIPARDMVIALLRTKGVMVCAMHVKILKHD